MPLTVHQFPCLSDNYGFLIRDEATGQGHELLGMGARVGDASSMRRSTS